MMSAGVVIAGDEACVGCLRGRLYEMRLVARVEVSREIRPGDLMVLDGNDSQMYRGVCRRCVVSGSGFEALLERIRKKEHPEFGALSWSGQSRQITETVQFEANCNDSDEQVRERALRYLEGLTEEEREAAEIDVAFREGKPVRAVVRAQTSELSPSRLRELRVKAGLK